MADESTTERLDGQLIRLMQDDDQTTRLTVDGVDLSFAVHKVTIVVDAETKYPFLANVAVEFKPDRVEFEHRGVIEMLAKE